MIFNTINFQCIRSLLILKLCFYIKMWTLKQRRVMNFESKILFDNLYVVYTLIFQKLDFLGCM